MKVRDIIDKTSVGDEVFVVRPMNIQWKSMRFENTSIVYAKYVVSEDITPGLWGTNAKNILKAIYLPEGTKQYPPYLRSDNIEYQCFKTKEEAEVWKVIELQQLEKQVEQHIQELLEKTQKKIKKIKIEENFDKYFEKYPEKFLKVM